MVIAIASGKGGTRKSIIAGSFASLAKNKVMADCDVDAADLYLLLHPAVKETHEFSGGKLPLLMSGDALNVENVKRFAALKQ